VGPIHKTQPYHVNLDKSSEKVAPMTCRLRDLTYECHIRSDMEYRCLSVDEEPRVLKAGVLK
jgi:DNA-directed RNA polymerase beta subunit